MTRWEYKVHKLADLSPSWAEDKLNDWGDEGFELIGIDRFGIGYFKRPKEPAREPFIMIRRDVDMTDGCALTKAG